MQAEFREGIGDLPGALIERVTDGRVRAASVDGAERFGTGGHGDIGIGMSLRSLENNFQKLGREAGQIARHDEVEVGCGQSKSGLDAGERAASGALVGDNQQTEMPIHSRRSDQRDVSGNISDHFRDVQGHRPVMQRQECFVGTHSGAGAAYQYETSARRQEHGEMVSLEIIKADKLVNRTMRSCFILLAAVAASIVLPAQTRVTSVVRPDARTGRLVRSVMVPRPAPLAPVSSAELDAFIDRSASLNEVEGPLVESVIKAESNYNPSAISPKGAQGLMQLIPSTARRFGVANSFNPEQNIEGGVKYLKYLLELYHQDYVKAIAAYNAGEGAVAKYGGIPPYPETRNYVAQVAKNLRVARTRAARKVKPAPVQMASIAAYNPIEASVNSDGKVYYRTP